MIIVVTHDGRTTNHKIDMLADVPLDDEAIVRLSEEILALPAGTLSGFVVDRITNLADGDRAYVRPKVPFGSERIGEGPGIMAVANLMQATDRDRLRAQLEIAVEALLQYSTSMTSGDRARAALAEIAALDEAS